MAIPFAFLVYQTELTEMLSNGVFLTLSKQFVTYKSH